MRELFRDHLGKVLIVVGVMMTARVLIEVIDGFGSPVPALRGDDADVFTVGAVLVTVGVFIERTMQRRGD